MLLSCSQSHGMLSSQKTMHATWMQSQTYYNVVCKICLKRLRFMSPTEHAAVASEWVGTTMGLVVRTRDIFLIRGTIYWVPAVGPQGGGQTKLQIGCGHLIILMRAYARWEYRKPWIGIKEQMCVVLKPLKWLNARRLIAQLHSFQLTHSRRSPYSAFQETTIYYKQCADNGQPFHFGAWPLS